MRNKGIISSSLASSSSLLLYTWCIIFRVTQDTHESKSLEAYFFLCPLCLVAHKTKETWTKVALSLSHRLAWTFASRSNVQLRYEPHMRKEKVYRTRGKVRRKKKDCILTLMRERGVNQCVSR